MHHMHYNIAFMTQRNCISLKLFLYKTNIVWKEDTPEDSMWTGY